MSHTDNKLFDVPLQKRKVIFYLGTYKGNRIAIKLMKLLRGQNVFNVQDIESLDETRIFEISIFSDKDFIEVVAMLKQELVNLMRKSLPDNYLFDLKNRRLGFVNSFNVFSDEGFHFEACHKIKEVRTGGGTQLPTDKITE